VLALVAAGIAIVERGRGASGGGRPLA
jgi:hypothetical protein